MSDPVGRAAAERWKGSFKVISDIAARSFMKRAKRIEHINAEDVASVAQQLEAALVMTEEHDGVVPISLEFTSSELSSFVAYMRQLDADYRTLAAQITEYHEKAATAAGKNQIATELAEARHDLTSIRGDYEEHQSPRLPGSHGPVALADARQQRSQAGSIVGGIQTPQARG